MSIGKWFLFVVKAQHLAAFRAQFEAMQAAEAQSLKGKMYLPAIDVRDDCQQDNENLDAQTDLEEQLTGAGTGTTRLAAAQVDISDEWGSYFAELAKTLEDPSVWPQLAQVLRATSSTNDNEKRSIRLV